MHLCQAKHYPNSFTNVCFSTKIEFSVVLFYDNHKTIVKCWWGSGAAVSSTIGSWQSLHGGSGLDRGPENF